ncbi:MAG TPA: hypothetical protein PK714_07225 [Nitrosomonas sp.]|jgi:hypothetical protein|nr:hypothetical protein [Nitrosomonas sp.]
MMQLKNRVVVVFIGTAFLLVVTAAFADKSLTQKKIDNNENLPKQSQPSENKSNENIGGQFFNPNGVDPAKVHQTNPSGTVKKKTGDLR